MMSVGEVFADVMETVVAVSPSAANTPAGIIASAKSSAMPFHIFFVPLNIFLPLSFILEINFVFLRKLAGFSHAPGMTDANGLVNLVVPAKSGIVTVTAEGFLATSRTVEVQPDANGVFSTTIGITPMNASVVDGSLKVEEMTYDEIVQAGISITAPENNHVWKFSAELQFVAGPALPFDLDTLPITGYYDDKGNFLGGSGCRFLALLFLVQY